MNSLTGHSGDAGAMGANSPPFVFIDEPVRLATLEDFLLQVPRGLQTERDVFATFSEQGRFPKYFGENWNALLDCLRDFHWLSEKRIIIAHGDLPLLHQQDQLRIYLEILESAVRDWRQVRPGDLTRPYTAHELLVAFPSVVEPAVARILRPAKH